MAVSNSGNVGGVATGFQIQRIADGILADPDTNPEAAILRASGLPDNAVRERTLLRLAKGYRAEKPDYAKRALQAIDPEKKDVAYTPGWRTFREMAETFHELGEHEAARNALDSAAKGLKKVYDADASPDDPNQAIKLFWPSTHAWRDLVITAYRISPAKANELVDSISDDQIRAMQRSVLGGMYLNGREWRSTSPMVAKKRPPQRPN